MVHMVPKIEQRQQAIRLRKQGRTYNEILSVVSVAKSTLSLWLRDVGLTKQQQQRLTSKKQAAQRKGALAKSAMRIERQRVIIEKAQADINTISHRELMLIGAALYWAEGCKAKPHNVSQCLDFGNSDVRMMLVFLAWIQKCLHVGINDIKASIYIHENHKHRIEHVKRYWLQATGLPEHRLQYVYYKRHISKTKRRNVGNEYAGLLRIRVANSTDLKRIVEGWVLGIAENYASMM